MVRGGKEEKIIAQIKEKLDKNNDSKKTIELYFIPHSTKPKNLLSGYIFCRGQLDENLVQLFYSVPGVISFLNHLRKEEALPSPLSPQKNAEFSSLLKKIEKGEIDHSSPTKGQKNIFQIDEQVRVVKGLFVGCKGKISAVDEKKKLITINIDFLGRLTPTEILMADCVKENQY